MVLDTNCERDCMKKPIKDVFSLAKSIIFEKILSPSLSS